MSSIQVFIGLLVLPMVVTAAQPAWTGVVDICGQVVKVGDVSEDQPSLVVTTERGESLKLMIEKSSAETAKEVSRAELALRDNVRYCALAEQVSDKKNNKWVLMRSSIEARSK